MPNRPTAIVDANLMADSTPPRRIEASFSQGWGVALLITLLAVGGFAGAGLLHRATFRSPNDVTAPYKKQEPGSEGADTAAGKAKH